MVRQPDPVRDGVLAMRTARPFLKWAGGKTQLLPAITARLPAELPAGRITRYVEPFVGSGAVFLHLAQHYPLAEFFLFDRNPELILAYRTLQTDCEPLIERLAHIQAEYHRLSSAEQKDYFYRTRAEFNAARAALDSPIPRSQAIQRTAQLIFLNRTCYNGLFRVNAKGEFNVPFGSYKNPRICDPGNLRAVSVLLQRVVVQHADFEACAPHVDAHTFVYFDPPYRPLTTTASFTAYARYTFDDDEQRRLAAFYRRLHATGAKLMLSNSDPHNIDPHDDFFDRLYAGFHLHRVQANRMINSNPARRGPITELLITNYGEA